MRKSWTVGQMGLLCVLASCLFQCKELAPDKEWRLTLVNNADHPIGYYVADGFKGEPTYPDSLPETNARVVYDTREESQSGIVSFMPWEDYFNQLPRDTLSIFIFHTDTLRKYSWDEVRDGYMILRRYDLSESDIRRLNSKLEYP